MSLSLPALRISRPIPDMKLARILFICALFPACATTPPAEAPGMPLDKELLLGNPEEALTATP